MGTRRCGSFFFLVGVGGGAFTASAGCAKSTHAAPTKSQWRHHFRGIELQRVLLLTRSFASLFSSLSPDSTLNNGASTTSMQPPFGCNNDAQSGKTKIYSFLFFRCQTFFFFSLFFRVCMCETPAAMADRHTVYTVQCTVYTFFCICPANRRTL